MFDTELDLDEQAFDSCTNEGSEPHALPLWPKVCVERSAEDDPIPNSSERKLIYIVSHLG